MKAMVASMSFFLFAFITLVFVYLSSFSAKNSYDTLQVTGDIGNLLANHTMKKSPEFRSEWKGPEIKFKPVVCSLKQLRLPSGQAVWYIQALMKNNPNVTTVKVTALLLHPDKTTGYQKLFRRKSTVSKQKNEVYGTYITRLSSAGSYTITLMVDTEELEPTMFPPVVGGNFEEKLMASKNIPCGNVTVDSSYEDKSKDYFPPAPVGRITVMWVNPSQDLAAFSWVATGDDLYDGKVSYYKLTLTKGKLEGVSQKIGTSVLLEDLSPVPPGRLQTYTLKLEEFGMYDEVNFYLTACDEVGKCSNSKEQTLVLRGRMGFVTEELKTLPNVLDDNDRAGKLIASNHLREKRFLDLQQKIESIDSFSVVPLSPSEVLYEEVPAEGVVHKVEDSKGELHLDSKSEINQTLHLIAMPSTRIHGVQKFVNLSNRVIVVRKIMPQPSRMSFYVVGAALMMSGLAFLLVYVLCVLGYKPKREKYFWFFSRKPLNEHLLK